MLSFCGRDISAPGIKSSKSLVLIPLRLALLCLPLSDANTDWEPLHPKAAKQLSWEVKLLPHQVSKCWYLQGL